MDKVESNSLRVLIDFYMWYRFEPFVYGFTLKCDLSLAALVLNVGYILAVVALLVALLVREER